MLGSCRWCCLAAAMHWVIHLPNWSFGVAQFRKPRTLPPARLHHSRKVAAVWRGMPWLRQQKRWWGGGSSFISLIPSWQNLKLLKFQQFSPVSVAAMFFFLFGECSALKLTSEQKIGDIGPVLRHGLSIKIGATKTMDLVSLCIPIIYVRISKVLTKVAPHPVLVIKTFSNVADWNGSSFLQWIPIFDQIKPLLCDRKSKASWFPTHLKNKSQNRSYLPNWRER